MEQRQTIERLDRSSILPADQIEDRDQFLPHFNAFLEDIDQDLDRLVAQRDTCTREVTTEAIALAINRYFYNCPELVRFKVFGTARLYAVLREKVRQHDFGEGSHVEIAQRISAEDLSRLLESSIERSADRRDWAGDIFASTRLTATTLADEVKHQMRELSTTA